MTEPRASRQSAFENALAELRAGRIERAEVLCGRILRSAPQDPAAHQLAATIALRGGRLDEAARWAKSSLVSAPRSRADPHRRGARGARGGRSCAGARPGPRAAARLTPDRPEAAFLTCVTLDRVGRRKSAVAFLKTCCCVFRTLSTVGARSAEALRKAGQPETAVLALARAAESSSDPMDHARLGAALQAIGRPQEAIVAFRRALEAAPDLAEARAALGSCLRQTGELQLARAELERAASASAAAMAAPGSRSDWSAKTCATRGARSRPIGAASRRSRTFPKPMSIWGSICRTRATSTRRWTSYRRAMRLRPDTFGRIAQALTSAKKGRLWLNPARLRRPLEA